MWLSPDHFKVDFVQIKANTFRLSKWSHAFSSFWNLLSVTITWLLISYIPCDNKLKIGNNCNPQKRNSIEILLIKKNNNNNCIEERVKCANCESHVNYWFSEINNRRYAHEYFFPYNHGLNPKNRNYFKIVCPNNIKVFIFVRCK